MSTALSGQTLGGVPPLVIAHRGASGSLPEHTLPAYALAIELGADFIEPDLVMTKDRVLIARHENEIGATTDVAAHAEFAGRRTTKMIDGQLQTGWFAEDFTLAEIKSLRARERLPTLRPTNALFDGQFTVPTLQEVINLVRGTNLRLARDARDHDHSRRPNHKKEIGLYPETKHPSTHEALGLPIAETLVEVLHRAGFLRTPHLVRIQSFEVASLLKLRRLTPLPLVQLISATGAPYDFIADGDARSYADLITPEGLSEIAGYAAAIGVEKTLILPGEAAGPRGADSPLIRDAHAAGLAVHAWTFRAENAFLPPGLRRGPNPAAHGDLESEIAAYLAAGIDGLFTDHPHIARAVLAARG